MGEKLAYSVPEAAVALGVSPWLVRKAIKAGQLPVVPKAIAGHRLLVPVAALEQRIADTAELRSAS